jgi:hypothetical protein
LVNRDGSDREKDDADDHQLEQQDLPGKTSHSGVTW